MSAAVVSQNRNEDFHTNISVQMRFPMTQNNVSENVHAPLHTTTSSWAGGSLAAATGPKEVGGIRRRDSCDLCVSRKRKCDSVGGAPCTLCRERNVVCHFSARARRGPKPKRPIDSTALVQQYSPTSDGSSSSSSDSLTTMSRLPKAPRLQPSSATGLVGLQESTYINACISAMNRMTLLNEDDIQLAIAELTNCIDMGATSPGGGNMLIAKDSSDPKRSAVMCSFFTSLALGALIQGVTDMSIVEVYIQNARTAIGAHYDHAAEEVLRAFLQLTVVMACMDDWQRFAMYLGLACNVARSLGAIRNQALREAQMAEAATSAQVLHAGGSQEDAAAAGQDARKRCVVPPPLHPDLWFMLQSMISMSLQLKDPDECGTRKCVLDPDAPDWCFFGASSSIPRIIGLPEKLAPFKDGCKPRDYFDAPDDSTNKLITSHLSELATEGIDQDRIEKLVTEVTSGGRLLQVILSTDVRVCQAVKLAMVRGPASAQPSLRALYLMLSRIISTLGRAFMSKGGLNQLKLLSCFTMVALALGEEAACLSSVQQSLSLTIGSPGLMRCAIWRHCAHITCALLLASRCEPDALELARAYNALQLPNDTLPLNGPALKDWCSNCPHFRCTCVTAILRRQAPGWKPLNIFIDVSGPRIVEEDSSPDLKMMKELHSQPASWTGPCPRGIDAVGKVEPEEALPPQENIFLEDNLDLSDEDFKRTLMELAGVDGGNDMFANDYENEAMLMEGSSFFNDVDRELLGQIFS